LPASASRISFLYIGRPSVGGFFHLHQPEVCWNWTMEQWNKFCKDCVQVLDATHFKWEPVKAKDGRPVIDKRTGQPKSISQSGQSKVNQRVFD